MRVNKGACSHPGVSGFPPPLSCRSVKPSPPTPRPNLSKTPDAQGQLTSGGGRLSTGHSQRERVPLPKAEVCKEETGCRGHRVLPSRPGGLGSLAKNLGKFMVSVVGKSRRAKGWCQGWGLHLSHRTWGQKRTRRREATPVNPEQERDLHPPPELSSPRGCGRPVSPRTRFSRTLRPTIPGSTTR